MKHSAMRTRHLLLILLTAALTGLPWHATAQTTTKTITLHYDEGDFNYVYDADSCLRIESPTYHLTYGEDTLKPAMPYIPYSILIGRNQSFQGLSSTSCERVILNNVTVAANELPYIAGTAPPIAPHLAPPTYSSPSYPDSSVVFTGGQEMDGYIVLGFLVCPFQYDAVQRVLSIRDSVTFSIQIQTGPYVPRKPHEGAVMRDIVYNLILNKGDLELLYPTNEPLPSASTGEQSVYYDYLLITDSLLAPAYQPLADWKTIKGVRTKLLTVEEIYNRYTGEPTPQLKIKRCIKNYKDSTGIQYVLLGGDDYHVPVQGCYGKVESNQIVFRDTKIPTDLFYACLGESGSYSFDWDYNQNDTIGEKTDHVDLTPDVFLTRIPSNTVEDATVMVKKIVDYEQCPPIEDWENRMLMSGSKFAKIDTVWIDSIPFLMTDSEIRGRKIYDIAIHNQWEGNVTFFYERGGSGIWTSQIDLTASHYQQELSKGYAFIDMLSHGGNEGWQLSSNKYYLTDSAACLKSTMPSIIVTSACWTNAFDSLFNTCLSKAFLHNSNSGVIGYIGSSRQGWESSSSAIGFSSDYNLHFYQYLFGQRLHKINIGKIMSEVKADLIILSNLNPYRWLQYAINPMGDPESTIYVETPKRMPPLDYYTNYGCWFFGMNNEEVDICITSFEDNGQSFYMKEKISGETIRICENLPDSFRVCVTKDGYVPSVYTFKRGENIYIQNDELNGFNHVEASRVYIGRNVTTVKPEGPVTLDRGELKIKANKSVLIKNDFEVKKGSSLIITNE